jgi:uncharacterized membrane protein YcjF (UPF0283 family)
LHSVAAGWGVAGLTALLALAGVFAVAPESQQTLRLWIRYRAQHRMAAAISFSIRRQVRSVTCRSHGTKVGASDVTRAVAKVSWSTTELANLINITRIDEIDQAAAEDSSVSVAASKILVDEVRPPLEIVQDRYPSEDGPARPA